jgi:hypothetical protein
MVAAGRCLNGRHYGELSLDDSEDGDGPGETPARCFYGAVKRLAVRRR